MTRAAKPAAAKPKRIRWTRDTRAIVWTVYACTGNRVCADWRKRICTQHLDEYIALALSAHNFCVRAVLQSFRVFRQEHDGIVYDDGLDVLRDWLYYPSARLTFAVSLGFAGRLPK